MRTFFLPLILMAFCNGALAQQPRSVVTDLNIDPDGTIHACAKKENGQLRIVDDPEDCLPSEVALSWNDPEPAPPAPRCCKKQIQFVGFSSRSLQGGDGILRMNLACQETFSESRICTSEEVAETTVLPGDVSHSVSPAPEPAWVRPSAIVGRGATIGIETTVALQADVARFSCAGWNDSSSSSLSAATGLTVNRHGQFALSSCGGTMKVACCTVIGESDD